MSDISVTGNEAYFNNKVSFFDQIEVNQNLKIKSGNLIIISPNGTQYKLIVSDSGTLSTEPLS